MHLEVEEKFPVRSAAIFGEIRAVGEVAGHALRDLEQNRIRHAYLDTDSGTLHGLGMSLRFREKGGGQFVTYKRHIDRTHVRGEIEEAITVEEARRLLAGATTHVHSQAVREAEKYLGDQRLRPVVRVENAREAWYFGADGNEVKICFDRLRFHNLLDPDAPVREGCELEVELQTGESSFLEQAARALMRDYGLISSPRSKYERGVALFGLFGTEPSADRSGESARLRDSERTYVHS